MEKIFIETCIKSSNNTILSFKNWLKILNFSHAVVESTDSTDETRIKDSFFFKRKTITSSTKNPKFMDKIRFNNDLLIFYCDNPNVTKWASQDQRVDGLQFPLSDINKLADDSTIYLLKQNDKFIDLNLREIVSNRFPIHFLRNIKKVVHRASKKQIPILLSSYANSPVNLRSSLSTIGFTHFIGLENDYYINVSQFWLFKRLERNRKRLNDNFISPGVWKLDNEESLD